MERQFQYKAWANGEIVDAIGRIDPILHPEQWRLAVRFLNHTYVVDRIFAAHLSGEPHAYQDTNTPDTPALEWLARSISKSDRWYEQYAQDVRPAQLDEPIAFEFTDGDKGSMTRREMLFHVLAHGTYHRGNIGMILSACGVERPKETFARFLHLREPSRRAQP